MELFSIRIQRTFQLVSTLDNQEVCLILKISPRTLQNLRDTDQISYSQIGKKIYYKKEDIQKFIEKHNRKL